MCRGIHVEPPGLWPAGTQPPWLAAHLLFAGLLARERADLLLPPFNKDNSSHVGDVPESVGGILAPWRLDARVVRDDLRRAIKEVLSAQRAKAGERLLDGILIETTGLA